MQEFKYGDPQHGPIGGRHPRDPPVVCQTVERGVEAHLLLLHSLHQRLRKIDERLDTEMAGQKPVEMFGGRDWVGLDLIQRLKGDLTGSTAAGHCGERIVSG